MMVNVSARLGNAEIELNLKDVEGLPEVLETYARIASDQVLGLAAAWNETLEAQPESDA